MYIGVFIDSENIHDLGVFLGKTQEEINDQFTEYVIDMIMGGATLKREAIEYGEDRLVVYKDDFFLVMEVFKVDDDKVYLVNWHGYDGVNFEVRDFPTKKDAYNTMREEYIEEVQYMQEGYLDHDTAIIDVGTEWLNWKIINY